MPPPTLGLTVSSRMLESQRNSASAAASEDGSDSTWETSGRLGDGPAGALESLDVNVSRTRFKLDGREATLPRVALSDRVKEYIVEKILAGELEPGDRIVESSLARKLGVSQAPVREAIRDLVLLGFLESKPYKGTSVRSFSPDDLWEVYTVRAALESLAARLAALHLTEEDAEELGHILEEMIEAGRREDLQTIAQLDNDFHDRIMGISRNRTLYHLWETLQYARWTIVTYRITTLDLEYLAARHEDLLEALRTGDPHRAARAMQRHIEDMGKPPENVEHAAA